MCWWAVVAQVGLQALGMRQQYSQKAKYLEAQARGATKEMNYAFQNYEIERQDAYDAAVNDIMKTRINQMQLSSQVEAAVAEGYGGGRTANRLLRAADADTSRTVSSIQDNYGRKSNEVDLNKEMTLLSTKDYIMNLKEQGKISKRQKLMDILSLATTGLQGYNEYKNQKVAAKNAGGGFGFWGSYNKKSPANTKLSANDPFTHFEFGTPKIGQSNSIKFSSGPYNNLGNKGMNLFNKNNKVYKNKLFIK